MKPNGVGDPVSAVTTVVSAAWVLNSQVSRTPTALSGGLNLLLRVVPVNVVGGRIRLVSIPASKVCGFPGIGESARIRVSIAGKLRVVESVEVASTKPVRVPNRCPACKSLLKNGRCVLQTCPVKLASQMCRWLSAVGVKGFGVVIIQRLIKAGMLTTVADLYRLNLRDVLGVISKGVPADAFNQRRVRGALAMLHKAPKKVKASVFFRGIGVLFWSKIPGGKKVLGGLDDLTPCFSDLISEEFGNRLERIGVSNGGKIAKKIREDIHAARITIKQLELVGVVPIFKGDKDEGSVTGAGAGGSFWV